MNKKAIVLFSGGLDSTTLLHVAARDGFDLYALTFDYGQNHIHEVATAKHMIDHIKKLMPLHEHRIISLNLRSLGGSALTSSTPVPKRTDGQVPTHDIPVTYVPARNTIFLSYALAWAEVLHSHDIYIGVNNVDYSGYPDCRPEYIQAFQTMANLATKEAVQGQPLTIHTPLIHLSKKDIILLGTRLGVNYANTHSCYDPGTQGLACGSCDSCLLRKKGFAEANLPDPTQYQ